MKYQIPRGTQDILPERVTTWQWIEETFKKIAERYHYKEIRTPIFEQTEVFARGVGETTDIVQKEMYTFNDRGGRSLTLRPEGTAAVVRSYVENKMYGNPNQPVKLYYLGPMFRYERPQHGRFRQFVQFGVEALGSNDPAIDAEVIALALDLYRAVGITNVKLVINSLGDLDSRLRHREALINHFRPFIHEFCEDCQNRLEQNPLRILDCKVDRDHELMKTAPAILDYLNEHSQDHFNEVRAYLDALEIPYTVDPTLVRGLDYYNHTAFEIMSTQEGFGAITSLCGGGRYNGLVEEFGGPKTPGIGFALSIERVISALEAEKKKLPEGEALDVYIITLGEQAKRRAIRLLHELRTAGFSCDMDYMGRKIKAQFKAADRYRAKYTIIIGDEELEKGVGQVKNMQTGVQEAVLLENIAMYLLKDEGGNRE